MAKNSSTLKLVVVGLAGLVTIVTLVAVGSRQSASTIGADAAADASSVLDATSHATADTGSVQDASFSAAPTLDASPTAADAAAAAAASEVVTEVDATASNDANLTASDASSANDASAQNDGTLPEVPTELAKLAFETEAPRLFIGEKVVLAKRRKVADLRLTSGSMVVDSCLGPSLPTSPTVAVAAGNYPVEIVAAAESGVLLARVVLAPGKVVRLVRTDAPSFKAGQSVACFVDAVLRADAPKQPTPLTLNIAKQNFAMLELDPRTHGNVVAIDAAHEEGQSYVYRAFDAKGQMIFVMLDHAVASARPVKAP